MITTEVENYPGYENPIQGPWLMEQMKKQSEAFGAKIINDYVTDVDFSQFPFVIRTEKEKYLSYSVIIATGAKAKWLGIPGEDKFMGFGVSACATCDGFFFKNKDVVVVGGGNTAVEEALFLSNICKKVTLIHRRDKLRAEKILQNRLFEKKNVEIKEYSNSNIDCSLTINGKTKKTSIPLTVKKTTSTKYVISSRFNISLSDYEIELPKLLFIPIEDKINIDKKDQDLNRLSIDIKFNIRNINNGIYNKELLIERQIKNLCL